MLRYTFVTAKAPLKVRPLTGLQVKEATETSSLHCASCDHALGLLDPSIEGWKLYKWSLSIVKDDDSIESFSVPKWISTQLLSIADNSGVKRFVVEPAEREDDKSDGLLVSAAPTVGTYWH